MSCWAGVGASETSSSRELALLEGGCMSPLSPQSLGHSHVPKFIRTWHKMHLTSTDRHPTDGYTLTWNVNLVGLPLSVSLNMKCTCHVWNAWKCLKQKVVNSCEFQIFQCLGFAWPCNKIGFAAFASVAGGAAQSWLRADIALWGTPRACAGAEPGAHFTHDMV